MYNINSKIDKPDIEYMYNRTVQLMDEGIQLGKIDNLYNEFISIQNEIGQQITKEYGILNPNSGPQIVKFMQELESMEVYEIACIDNKWSSNKEILGALALMGHQFAKDILEYRKAKKSAESLKSMIDARTEDGRVHPSVSLSKTNRINYSGPALMNIPKKLLWNVVAPRKEGNILFSADIKNQEPNILINLLGIDELKDALLDDRGLYETLFEKPFRPVTKLTVYVTNGAEKRIVPTKEMSESTTIPPVYYTPIKPLAKTTYFNNEMVRLIDVCNTITPVGEEPLLPKEVAIETENGNVFYVPVEWDDIQSKKLKTPGMIEVEGRLIGTEIRCEGVYRKEFKQSWNAMTYGASIFGIKRMCKNIDGDIVYKYFSKIPQFKAYKTNCTKLAESGRQTINTFFGTQLYAGETDTNRLKRVFMDLPIQGTGADILSMLIKHFDTETEKRGLNGKLSIYYTRHDELILEADKDWLEEVGIYTVKYTIKDLLEHQIDEWTPFKIEVKEIERDTITLLSDDVDDMFE